MQPNFTDMNTTTRARRRLARHALLGAAVLAAALAAPNIASAADTLVAADPAADEVTALDGTVVWVSGSFGNQRLMQLTAGGVAAVMGAPKAKDYRTIDLGKDSKGRLVLTYQRCSASKCTALLDNLKGTRASFKHLTLKRCTLTTAPAVWRDRMAYGQLCRKTNKQIDDSRSGLYVKTAGSPARIKHLRRPKDARKFHINQVTSVDLRGTDAAAVASDVFEYAFVERTNGKNFRSIFAAASEGDSDESARGLALGSGATMYALTTAAHAGDPNRAILFRVGNTCYDTESLINPVGPDDESGFRATDVAVDGSTVYLVVPGSGIVVHPFTPEGACTPL